MCVVLCRGVTWYTYVHTVTPPPRVCVYYRCHIYMYVFMYIMDLSFLLSVVQRRKGRTAATKSAKLVKKLNEQVCLYSYVHPYT